MIALLGPSGQGKSTLLRILALLEKPDEGELSFQGRLSDQWSPREWRMHVCYVAQQPIMLPGTVEDNLKTASRLHSRTFERDLALRLMAEMGLSDMDWNKQAADLSGGEKQRVALVRSMLLRSPVLLLDEVTSSLDVRSKYAVGQTLQNWHRDEGCTLIWVTHDVEEARSLSRRIWFMEDGKLLEDCAARDFFTSPSTDLARSFLVTHQALKRN